MNWFSFELLPKHQERSHYYEFGEVRIWFMSSHGYDTGEGESRGIRRIKCIRLWMNQSCFSLGFLSQNSLWKLSKYRGYKGIYIVG